MPVDIPGFYYDTEKNKYFKIETSQTASSRNPYTASSIAARRATEAAETSAAQRILSLNKHISRHPFTTGDSTRGACLAREFGSTYGTAPGIWHGRQQLRRGAADAGQRVWGSDVRVMGRLQFQQGQWPGAENPDVVTAGYGRMRQNNLVNMWVGGCGGSGTGVAYTAMQQYLTGAYIPFKNGRIEPSMNDEEALHLSGLPTSYQLTFADSISAITCNHEQTRMFLASSDPVIFPQICIGEIPQVAKDPRDDSSPSSGLLTSSDFSMVESFASNNAVRDLWIAYSLRLAPRSSEICVSLGGTRGLVQMTSTGQLYRFWSPRPRQQPASSQGMEPRDIFAHDFLQESASVTIAGGGGAFGGVWTLDARVGDTVNKFKHGAGVVNLEVMENHKVVVAGLKDRMCIYDLRYTREAARQLPELQTPEAPPGPGVPSHYRRPKIGASADPLISFPGYRNRARYGLGFAMDQSLGVVCTATDSGKASLHSLKTGRRLNVPAIDAVDGGGAPITSMQFAQLDDGTGLPSLYMGVGAGIYKFSGVGEEELEWLRDREEEKREKRRRQWAT